MVVEGSALAAQLKSQVSEVRVTPAGEGASCVVRVTVEYKRLDSVPLAPEDQAKLVQGYLNSSRGSRSTSSRTPTSSPELPLDRSTP
ncbi:hypothetical protein BAE44_0014341 [Dichanthelium oligosanthes]|uniref:Bet v I/Major latex protein domain-containing protein n=1 Tax=Dichanthelium oligosanthes TaxID=888268 RepID=A0A1E5VHN3_9POAL|nr:hypothetical protein BAE44_0014341 [Dichanthelium oligosanthes]